MVPAFHDFQYILLHDLRHTSATIVNQGVQAKIISEQTWAWKHHDNNEHLWTQALRVLLISRLLISSNHSLHLKLHNETKEDAQEFLGVFFSFRLISGRFLHQFYIKLIFRPLYYQYF
jgi:hypothetical protein